jgi:hypothetical protein
MAEKPQSVSRRIEAQIKKGKLDERVAIVYRLQGGHNEDAVDESLVVTAAGQLRLEVDDRIAPERSGEATAGLAGADALELIRSLVDGTTEMVTASEARFLPDSLVGSVTVILGDEKQTYYFAADEDIRKHHRTSLKPRLQNVLARVRDMQTIHIPGKRPKKLPTGQEKR